jgi:hypothetical protein
MGFSPVRSCLLCLSRNNVISATSGASSDIQCADPGENGEMNFALAFDRLPPDVTLVLSVI